MMKFATLRLSLTSICLGIWALPANSIDNESFSLSKQQMVGTVIPAFMLEIKSKLDKVVVTDVIVDRGNCGGSQKIKEPQDLKFGQSVQLIQVCDFIEVEIHTDQGTVVYTWE